MARGKKRFIYDFNVTLDIEIIVEAGISESVGGDSVIGAYVRNPGIAKIDNYFQL